MAMSFKTKILWISFLFIVGLVGCSQQTEAVLPTDTPVPLVETETPAPQPTETDLPGLVVLLSQDQNGGEHQVKVEEAAAVHGLAFEVRQGMTVEESPQNLQAVVSLGEMPGLEGLISSLPGVQFVVLGAQGLPESPNLTVLDSAESLPALAFMAGYIAAVQAEEWRIGIISTTDAAGQTYRDAFLNGVHYFCGICNPEFPPYEPYPLYAEVPTGGGEAAIQQAADDLVGRAVDMVHVAPALQSVSIYQYLAQRGVRIVGTDAPPAGLESNWVASIIPTPEMEFASVLDSALNGLSLGKIAISLHVNYTGISPARVTHFAEIISKLDSGEIDPVGLVD
jgi:hypothetical protein